MHEQHLFRESSIGQVFLSEGKTYRKTGERFAQLLETCTGEVPGTQTVHVFSLDQTVQWLLTPGRLHSTE